MVLCQIINWFSAVASSVVELAVLASVALIRHKCRHACAHMQHAFGIRVKLLFIHNVALTFNNMAARAWDIFLKCPKII